MVAMNVWPTDAADGSVSSEARWRKMARHWTPSGVLAGVGSEMAPTLAYPNLTVKAGACWVDGHYCELPGDQVLAVTANGLTVVRFDPAANTAELLYRDGATTPAQNPNGTWEQPIAKITGSALTDVRQLVSASTSQFVNGTINSANIGVGLELVAASITLPIGTWILTHIVQISSTAAIKVGVKIAIGGVLSFENRVEAPGTVATLPTTLPVVVTAPITVTATINNNRGGTAALTTFADPATQRIFATRVST